MKLPIVGLVLVLTVSARAQTAPVFVSQPSNVSTSDGGSFTVNVTVNTSSVNTPTDFGFGFIVNVPVPAGVSWKVNLRNRSLDSIGIATAAVNNRITASIVFGPITAADAGSFQIVATNVFGATLSEVRTLTVTPSGPSITAQPSSQTVVIGNNATLTVGAGGTAPLSYQWRKDGAAIAGATNAALTLSNVQASAAGSYTVTVTNSVASVTSAAATISLAALPTISANPSSLTVMAGTGTTLTAVATGTAPLTYQWRKEGTPIAGATNATLNLANVQPSAAGSYTVTVTNVAGSITSSAAVLSVTLPNVSRLSNLSILTALSSPTDTFTLGFVVGGGGTTGTKPLVIRAAGPSLGALGVAGTLDDPKIDLFSGATKTAENDNWGGSAALSNAMAGVGAFAYMAPTSRDAAVIRNFSTGDQSVAVSSAGTGFGTVIAEIYDASPTDTFTAATPRLVNVSVLKHLGGGVTAGFVVAGERPLSVLIRAVGPTLGAAPFNVGGAVADPQVTLFSGSAQIASNDNWGGGATMAAAFSGVGAFALPAASRDAAIVSTLQPGNYTVQVGGVGNTTGVALVEIYEVP